MVGWLTVSSTVASADDLFAVHAVLGGQIRCIRRIAAASHAAIRIGTNG
jgi:hypothetical protein